MTMPRIRRQCSVSLKTTAARRAAKGTWICTAMAAVAASTFSMPAKIMPKCSTPSVTDRAATWKQLAPGQGRRKGESAMRHGDEADADEQKRRPMAEPDLDHGEIEAPGHRHHQQPQVVAGMHMGNGHEAVSRPGESLASSSRLCSSSSQRSSAAPSACFAAARRAALAS